LQPVGKKADQYPSVKFVPVSIEERGNDEAFLQIKPEKNRVAVASHQRPFSITLGAGFGSQKISLNNGNTLASSPGTGFVQAGCFKSFSDVIGPLDTRIELQGVVGGTQLDSSLTEQPTYQALNTSAGLFMPLGVQQKDWLVELGPQVGFGVPWNTSAASLSIGSTQAAPIDHMRWSGAAYVGVGLVAGWKRGEIEVAYKYLLPSYVVGERDGNPQISEGVDGDLVSASFKWKVY